MTPMKLTRRTALTLTPAVLGAVSDWPSFRGPQGSGVADGSPLPVDWDPATGKNVRWKVDIQGTAHSSPVIANGRLYLTSAVPDRPTPPFSPANTTEEKDPPGHRWNVT